MRYSIDDVWWIDPRFKGYMLDTCPFPETLHAESWGALRAYFEELIGKAEFVDWFIKVQSDLYPLAECIISNW